MRRFIRNVKVDKRGGLRYLSSKKRGKLGRSFGKIVCRYKRKTKVKQFRIIDIYRSLWNVYGRVIKFDFRLGEKTTVALVSYQNGILSYLPAVYGFRLNTYVFSASFLPRIVRKAGNATFLASLPIQRKISSLEIFPMKGAQYLKSNDSFGKIIKKNLFFSWIKLRSGCTIKISNLCFATLGIIRGLKYNLKIYKKAGFFYNFGRRPHVRGVAKNPVDHPHGGGEGKKSGKSISMSPWGKLIKGKKTSK